MSISKYSHTIMLHTRSPWSRRTSPSFERLGFDRLRKRRQSAPALSLAVPPLSSFPGSSTQTSPDTDDHQSIANLRQNKISSAFAF
ncbi:unnamed protein product [Gongylonema pulchrum]|uniref:Uncharacterized protein n=1 Tax=Gongylonema pulchrum TaxID=637853 RepID=A0A183D0Q0_9BILA|nr:unnamed protein product [Gongylonema pulchrum]